MKISEEQESIIFSIIDSPNHSMENLLQLAGIDPKTDLVGADLSKCDFSRMDLSEADLRDVDLTDANLSFANLSNANLSGADLTGATLDGINTTGALLGNTILGKENETFARDKRWNKDVELLALDKDYDRKKALPVNLDIDPKLVSHFLEEYQKESENIQALIHKSIQETIEINKSSSKSIFFAIQLIQKTQNDVASEMVHHLLIINRAFPFVAQKSMGSFLEIWRDAIRPSVNRIERDAELKARGSEEMRGVKVRATSKFRD